jgi:hypothetical protein
VTDANKAPAAGKRATTNAGAAKVRPADARKAANAPRTGSTAKNSTTNTGRVTKPASPAAARKAAAASNGGRTVTARKPATARKAATKH